mmetsp:Transcript_32520/g.110433  ORF Transcript_32520/g.110433 Transcript_32520/m.110433 type:complete len:187 (-) Transcript_32520:441-1001(-)
MAYSVLLILAAAYPRRRDHFLEDQPLKLHIIKTCAEWTIGIQPRDLNESHWIVKGESNGDRKHGVLPKAKTVPKAALVNENEASVTAASVSSSGELARTHRSEPRVRASYSLLHSPFFSQFLKENAATEVSRSLRFRLGLTMETARVYQFLKHHTAENESIHRYSINSIRLNSYSCLVGALSWIGR